MNGETTIGIRLPSKPGDSFRLLCDVSDITKEWYTLPWNLKDGRQLHRYETLVATSNFDGCFDYGRGFLAMYVTTRCVPIGEDIENFETEIYMCSIDDSAWRATAPRTKSLDEANELTDRVYEFMKSSYGGALYCTEEQLNTELRKFGIYGQCE